MTKETKQQLFTPAFPTMPIQDKLGQVIVNFGMSKIEYAAIIIAAQIRAATIKDDSLLPETIAQEATLIATEVIKEVGNILNDSTAEDSGKSSKLISL